MASEWICTGPMCNEGKVSVDQMGRTFNLLLSNSRFNRQRFEPLVISIEASFHEQYSFYSPYIPFNPACCAVKEIGAQAEQVTADMLQSVGAAPIPKGPGTSEPPFSMDGLVMIGALVLGTVLLGNVQALRLKK